ncbi:MAG TPA: hypothetical protein P5050_02775 [Bacteroidia bacterium]|nr:hypothetical protein [Sphingobacteriales bacterium]HPD65001.1 hypothetical protein [Bacteroidia bacterium]HRS58125.1 hypothetical protein [Bacteroidia bacterium]HRU68764.1 hypothetical protein [Bacteroidia bacterium]
MKVNQGNTKNDDKQSKKLELCLLQELFVINLKTNKGEFSHSEITYFCVN